MNHRSVSLGTRRAVERASTVTPAASGNCAAIACWYVYSSTDSDFEATGTYGYGSTTLGSTSTYFEVKLNNNQSTSKPVQSTMSNNISALMMTGEREYYSSACPKGCPVSNGGTASYYRWGAVPAEETIVWPDGYTSNPPTVTYGTVVHQWLWTVAGYPGSWYLYGKSVTFTACSLGRCFGSATDVGEDAVNAGWTSAGLP